MRFVILTALRETRSAWKRLVFFFICIAIGVGAIVALRSVIQSVRGVLSSEARTLLAADILVSSDRPWQKGTPERIASRIGAIPNSARSESIEMVTMARPVDESAGLTKVVELRAVQPGFPFYGRLTLQGGQTYSHALLRNKGALVRPELLAQLGLKLGDEIVIGKSRFTVKGVIALEPGRSLSAFSLGPRVLIDYDDLAETGLVGFGSRLMRQMLLRIPDSEIDGLARDLQAELRPQFVRVRSYRDRQEQIGEDFERAENYLSLVGLVIVVLGGIAVSSVTRVFIRQKIKSIAVMKCVGGTSRQILAVYLVQALALGMLGSVIGVALAWLAIAAIPDNMDQIGTLTVAYGLSWSAAAQGIAIGVLVALLFAMVPLLEIRRIKPSLLLRQDTSGRRRDWFQIAATAVVGGALVALASWQAASLRVGLSVCLGFVGLTFILHGAGWVLTRLTRPLSRSRWFPMRQAVLHLARPGNQTRVILLTVGLGTFFIMGVRGLQVSLLEQFALQIGENTPDMFLVDIQQDQAVQMKAFLAERLPVTSQPLLIPVLRARVTGKGGSLDEVEDLKGRGMLSREYTITYRGQLAENETLVEGRFPSPTTDPARLPEVSIEEGIVERFDIGVGDVMRFDVLGRSVHARVSGIRRVEWREGRSGGFMFVFGRGTFENAPHWFFAPVRANLTDAAQRARLTHDLVVQFPNVSVIDLREVLEAVRKVFGVVTVAIDVVGSLVILTGGLILVGAVAVTKFQRVYEAAIFKTLGASSRTIAAMLMVEYGLLGTLAGAVGSFGAIALAWGVSRYALDIPWQPALHENVVATAATSLLIMVIGVAASADVLRRKPLAALRAE
ncbi:MAG TPA: FtsX-like permease family protein [Vicinamibacterales bacterium]|nr:FtsX-like permease family protein [Vicinamibacterales bacterium]